MHSIPRYLLGWRRWLHRRERGQGVVEFGMIVAGVALVGIAGLSILGRAEEGYFIPMQQAMAPPPPSGGTDVVHPTSVTMHCDVVSGGLGPSTVFGGQAANLSCSFTVVDTWSSKRTPPLGNIHLFGDAGPQIGQCALAAFDSVSSKCSPNPWLVSWTPGIHPPHYVVTLRGQYREPDGGHQPGPDATQTMTVEPNIQFDSAPRCGPSGGPNSVEVGDPISCVVGVYNATDHTAAQNEDVTWSAVGGSGSGDPFFTCATGNQQSLFANAIWNTVNWGTPQSCQPGPSLSCRTDSAGQCSVIFRRIRSPMAAPAAGDQHLNVRLTSGVNMTSGSGPWVGPAVVIGDATVQHHTMTWNVCKAAPSAPQPPGTTITPFDVSVGASDLPRIGGASYDLTADLIINGLAGSAVVSCRATVIDINPTPALDCAQGPPASCAADPDTYNAHSPVGDVTWTFLDKDRHPIPGPGATCTLTRVDVLPTGQPPDQTPYASSCTAQITLTRAVASVTENELDDLVIVQTPSATHIDSGVSHTTHVGFRPS